MSKTTPEEACDLSDKYGLQLSGPDCHKLAALIDEVRAEMALKYVSLFGELQNALEKIDEVRGVDAESPLSDVRAILYQCDRGNISLPWLIDALRGIVERGTLAPSQPVQDERSEWLQESAYRAGAAAGFNLGVSEDHEGLERLKSAHAYPKPAAPVELPVVALAEVQPATVTITKAGWQYLAVGGVPVKSVYGKSNELEKLRDQINAAIAAGRKAS